MNMALAAFLGAIVGSLLRGWPRTYGEEILAIKASLEDVQTTLDDLKEAVTGLELEIQSSKPDDEPIDD